MYDATWPTQSLSTSVGDSGSVTYADLQPGEYFVRLIAKIGTCATNRFRRKVEVPCRVLLKYVRRSRRYIIVKFAGVGIRGTALTSFTYSLDGQDAQPCKHNFFCRK